MGKPVKTPSLNWTEVLPPPPSASELSQYVEEEEELEVGYVPEQKIQGLSLMMLQQGI